MTPESAAPYTPTPDERARVYTAIRRLPVPAPVADLVAKLGPELVRWGLAKGYIPDNGADWTVPLLMEECRPC